MKREMALYVFFGCLTTLINMASYWFLSRIGSLDYQLAASIAWIVSVLFAYTTNKWFVFSSHHDDARTIIKELANFLFFRIFSYLIDIGFLIVLVEWQITGDFTAKVLGNIVVIMINYLASKFIIFKVKNSAL